MMSKVEGKDGDIREAWKWTKKVVWEYELIKKKALKWKEKCDKCRCKNRTNTFEEASISSDSSLDS